MNKPLNDALTTKRYQTRRKREISVREEAKKERLGRTKSAQLAAAAEAPDPDEYVVPINEGSNLTRYWRESRVRRDWATLYGRLGLPATSCEAFIASRRRPPFKASAKDCGPLKYPGWYLGSGGSAE